MNKKMILSFVIFLAGCATLAPGGFLENYAGLSHGKYLEKVMINAETRGFKGSKIQVGIPEVLETNSNADFPLEEARNYLKNSLEVNLRNSSGFQVATATEGGTQLKLETAITKLDPGSQAMRWFASELGAGHSIVQVEGKLTDLSSGKVLLEFADRRAGSGSGGLDITGGNAKEMIKDDLDGITKALAQTLNELG